MENILAVKNIDNYFAPALRALPDPPPGRDKVLEGGLGGNKSSFKNLV